MTLEANRSRTKSEKHVIEVVIKKFICHYKKLPLFFFFFLFFLLFFGGEGGVVCCSCCCCLLAYFCCCCFSPKTGKCFCCKLHVSLKWQICASSSANVHLVVSFPGPFYFTSTEASEVAYYGQGWGGGGAKGMKEWRFDCRYRPK